MIPHENQMRIIVYVQEGLLFGRLVLTMHGPTPWIYGHTTRCSGGGLLLAPGALVFGGAAFGRSDSSFLLNISTSFGR